MFIFTVIRDKLKKSKDNALKGKYPKNPFFVMKIP
jgi:hypothetical protein